MTREYKRVGIHIETVETDVDCKSFQHKLSYVTDREDYVQCNKCFRHWKLMENEKSLPSRKMNVEDLYKLRRKYK